MLCFKHVGAISKRLEVKFDSNISSTKSDFIILLTKVWDATDRLSITRKFNLSDKMKWGFFKALAVSILLYGCTTWTHTKHRKILEDNFTRMLPVALNKS